MKKQPAKPPDNTASINALSEQTGVDRRTIKKRLSGLKPKGQKRGMMFDRDEAVKAIQSGSNKKTGDIIKNEARKLAAQATREEIKAAREGGKVVEVLVVERAWESVVNLMKKRLLLISTKFESQWRADMNQQQAKKLVETEVDEALSELAKDIEYFSLEEAAENASEDAGTAAETED